MLQIQFEEFPIITTERLRLRQFTIQDAPAFYEMRTNSNFRTYLDRPVDKDIESLETLIKSINKQFAENESVCWVISSKDKNDFIGSISFWKIDKAHHRAEIGYGIHPNFQQQGYMSEAMKSVIDYGFKVMNLHSIEANINPSNEASINLAKKFNFVQEAYFRENYYYDGKFLDSAIFSLVNRG